MILITGWTGNTGCLVLQQLLQTYSPDQIVGVSRSRSEPSGIIIQEQANLQDENDVEEIFRKYSFSAVIHIANIRYSPVILKLADKCRVPHAILVHTTGKYSKYRTYSELYETIEQEIFKGTYSNTKYTILRPTMIYGNERDHNMHKLIKFLSKYPLFPIFGDGNAKMQPIHVQDLADTIVKVHLNRLGMDQDYDLSGGSVVTYNQVLRLIAEALNRNILFMHIPLGLAVFAARLYEMLPLKRIVTTEQVKRLQEDKSYSHDKAKDELGFSPRSFESGIVEEIRLLRQKGMIK